MFTAFRNFAASNGASDTRRAGFSSRSAVLFALAACSLPFGLSLTGCTASSTVSPSTVTGTSTKPLPTTTSGTTGTTTGTTGTTPGTTPATSNGALDLTFSNPSGTNVDTSAIHTTTMGGLGLGAAGFNNLVINGSVNAGGNLRTVQILLDTSGTAVVGTAYSANSQGSELAGTVIVTQTPISGTSVGTPSGWTSSGGTIVVDSITGKTYKLRLVNVTMSKAEGDDTASTGSFTLNGTATITVP